MKFKLLALSKLIIGAFLLGLTTNLHAQFRNEEPAILVGEDLGSLEGVPVDQIAGFRWTNSGWQQIPIQIDERHWKTAFELYGKENVDVAFEILDILAYADEKTFSGLDEDPNLDADDELVFMPYMAGLPFAEGNYPSHTIGAPFQISLRDELTNTTRYIYLFQQDGSLNPDAGQDLINYEYQLLQSGPFQEAYVLNGYNPEDSEVTTSYYKQHYSDDWLHDGLILKTGNTPNADLLDYYKMQYEPGACARHPGTFSAGAGMHIASFDGPIRAIRSWIGANSGSLITRTHTFYEQMDEITTHFRVHPIRGIMGYYDFSTEAADMTFYNQHNLSGVAVDGSPDLIDTTFANWSLLAGDQGSILMYQQIASNFPIDTIFSYYADQANSPVEQCIGDPHEVAANGWWIGQNLPNTDPRLSNDDYQLVLTRKNFFLGQNKTPATTQYLLDYLDSPLLLNEASVSAIEELESSPARMEVVPNPASDQIQILAEGIQQGQLEIWSLDGRHQWSTKFRVEDSIQLPARLEDGMYLIRVIHEHGTASSKLLIQR